MTCNTKNLYESLEYCPGETILPGMYDEILYIQKSQILSFPELPKLGAEGLTLEKIGTLSGEFALAADAYFLQMQVLDTACSLTSASQGEHPSKTFTNTATIKYPGTHAAAVGFCRLANADDLVFVFHMRAGGYRVLGNNLFRTNINPTQESGAQVTDASGTTLEVSNTDLAPAPYYTGKLPVKGGKLDCSTGVVTANAD